MCMLLGQGSSLRRSCGIAVAMPNLNLLGHMGTSLGVSFFFFYNCMCGIWKLPGWGGVESEPQLPAYTTATARQDPNCICDLHHAALGNARSLTHWARPGIKLFFPLFSPFLPSSHGSSHLPLHYLESPSQSSDSLCQAEESTKSLHNSLRHSEFLSSCSGGGRK